MGLGGIGDRRSSRAAAALTAWIALVLPAAWASPATPAREVVFVVDLSDAMRGAPLEEAKASLGAALAGLRPVDTFNVLALGARTRALFPASWPARPESLDKAARWIDRLEADGGAEVLRGLADALGPPDEGYATPGTRPVREVVVLAPGAIGATGAIGAIGQGSAGGEPAATPQAPRVPSPGPTRAAGAASDTAALLLGLGAGLALFAAALAYALRRGLAAPEAAR